MRLADPRSRRVALALNGAPATITLFRYEVDTCVGQVELRRRWGAGFSNGSAGSLLVEERNPVLPEPNFREPFPVHRIFAKVRPHEPFEESSLLDFGLRNGTDVVEGALESVVAHGWSSISISLRVRPDLPTAVRSRPTWTMSRRSSPRCALRLASNPGPRARPCGAQCEPARRGGRAGYCSRKMNIRCSNFRIWRPAAVRST